MQKTSSVTLVDFEKGIQEQLNANKEHIDKFLSDIATKVRDNAKATSSFADKTGNLRRSIKKRKSKYIDGGYIVTASGKSGDKGYHAHLVEFGHVLVFFGKKTNRRVPPHPFMRPALEKARAEAITKIGNGR